MSAWVLEAELAVLLAFLATPLVLPIYIWNEYRVRATFGFWQGTLGFFMFLYAMAIPAFTLMPIPESDYCEANAGVDHTQLNPLNSIVNVVDELGESGLVATLTGGIFLEVLFNVLFFVPLGFLLAFRYRWSLGRVLLAGFGLSLAIELTQATAVWGLFDCPYRLADVDDLITNTTGAGLGWLIGRWLTPVLPRVSGTEADDLAPPGNLRRLVGLLGDYASIVLAGLTIGIVWSAVAAASGGSLPEQGSAAWFAGTVVIPVFATQFLLPLARTDRASPGKLVVWLGIGDISSRRYSSRNAVFLRCALRWLSFVAIAWLEPTAAFVIVTIVEGSVAMVRKDNRSLSGLITSTDVVTRRAVEEVSARINEPGSDVGEAG